MSAAITKNYNRLKQKVTEAVGGSKGSLDNGLRERIDYTDAQAASITSLNETVEFYHKQESKWTDTAGSKLDVYEALATGFNKRARLIKQDGDNEKEASELAALYTILGSAYESLHPIHSDFTNGIFSSIGSCLQLQTSNIKSYQALRKKLEGKRLDVESAQSNQQKAKKESPALDEALRQAHERYEAICSEVSNAMDTVNESYTIQQDSLNQFLDEAIQYHEKSLKTLLDCRNQKSSSRNTPSQRDVTPTRTSPVPVANADRREDQSTPAPVANARSRGPPPPPPATRTRTSQGDITKPAPIPNTAPSHEKNETVAPGMLPPRRPNPVKTAKPSVIAKYAFQAEAPTELSLAKGDIIQVLQNIDDNWARGRCNDKEGIFPLNYTEPYAANEGVAPESSTGLNDTPKSNSVGRFSYLGSGQVSGSTNTLEKVKSRESLHNALAPSQPVVQASACGTCGCKDFSANMFKGGNACNNCFHSH